MKERGSGNNEWDFCWSYIRFKYQGLSIIPRNNLTSNIGVYGLHNRGRTENHFRPYDVNFVAKNHPKIVERNIEYDKHHFKNYINKKNSLLKRIINKIKRIWESG